MNNWEKKWAGGNKSASKQIMLDDNLPSPLFHAIRTSIGVYGRKRLTEKTEELKQTYNESNFYLVRVKDHEEWVFV